MSISKPTAVEIDGRAYELKLSLGTILDFEEESGKLFLHVIKPAFDALASRKELMDGVVSAEGIGLALIGELIEKNAISGKDLATLLWACLGGSKSELTVREAAELVRPGNVIQLFQAIFRAASVTLRQETGEEAADPNPN